MPVDLEEVRKVALALPETTEEPHHDFGSFRVRGKIFATMPAGGKLLHIFLPEEDRELALALDPEFLEPVVWGGKVVGVRAKLEQATKATVLELVRRAYAYKEATARKMKSGPTSPSAPTRVRRAPGAGTR